MNECFFESILKLLVHHCISRSPSFEKLFTSKLISRRTTVVWSIFTSSFKTNRRAYSSLRVYSLLIYMCTRYSYVYISLVLLQTGTWKWIFTSISSKSAIARRGGACVHVAEGLCECVCILVSLAVVLIILGI